jgi:hypothetical protein
MTGYNDSDRELDAEIEAILGNPPPEEPPDPQWDLAIAALLAEPTIVRAASASHRRLPPTVRPNAVLDFVGPSSRIPAS